MMEYLNQDQSIVLSSVYIGIWSQAHASFTAVEKIAKIHNTNLKKTQTQKVSNVYFVYQWECTVKL